MDGGAFDALTPKDETQAARFVRDNPLADGRGVIVAILDTGVDPGASGLHTTSDGRPKILDMVECSGSGDVDMSTIRKASPDLTIEGITGRVLLLNPTWQNPSGTWRVGAKSAWELYPTSLRSRMKSERAALLARETALLAADLACGAAAAAVVGGLAAAEADKRVAALKDALGVRGRRLRKTAPLPLAPTPDPCPLQEDDGGRVYDVVAWHDGTTWRAALDTGCVGDLRTAPGFASFRVERQWGVLDPETLLSYALNVYDAGATVSVVTDAGAHGTHVAGIVSAHHPRHSHLCGVAPGAQIVSLKIGDSRLGSMETGTGLVRALRAILDNGCDVVNMSYGEQTGC